MTLYLTKHREFTSYPTNMEAMLILYLTKHREFTSYPTNMEAMLILYLTKCTDETRTAACVIAYTQDKTMNKVDLHELLLVLVLEVPEAEEREISGKMETTEVPYQVPIDYWSLSH